MMRNWPDVVAHVQKEIDAWFITQCRNTYTRFYLWYRETTADLPGEIIISENSPGRSFCCAKEISRNHTTDENFGQLIPILRRLPILAREQHGKTA